MDHHESIKDSIARELAEEVNLTGDFTYQIMVVEEPGTLKRINAWQIRLVFEILPTNATFEPGKDGDEICFIDPAELKDSSHSSERKIYEYSLLKPARS